MDILRKKLNDTFVYYYSDTKKEINKCDAKRINDLRIPPAWTDVVVSRDPDAPIQAVGLDSNDKKQYIYHKEHVERAEKQKFIRLYDFIKAMPKLEERMKKDVKLRPYDKFHVISTMLSIVRELHIRVGKECYAQQNKSYGISSLRKNHVRIEDDVLYLRFRAKSKKQVSYTLKNKMIVEHIKMLLMLDGDRLFQYVDDDKTRNVTDMDLNKYIQDIMGDKFFTKDFRTYAANHHFVRSLLQETQKRSPKNDKVIKKNVKNAIKNTAFYLRHTKAISKKSYIMNFCIDMYSNDTEFFINNKYEDPNKVLMIVLKRYKKTIK